MRTVRPVSPASSHSDYFIRGWQPRVQPIVHARQSLALLRRPFSFYGAPLESAFAPVFTQLGLPWTPAGPSRIVAITLAVTFGWCGGHHLYLGDRRQALRYAAFFWTMVPIVLALRDAVQLVLIDQADFDRRYAPAARQLARV